jgi:ATP/maltotriose-dependent transcriptional regulator MalT
MALESLGMVLAFRGDYEEAEPYIERAIQAARQASARRYLSIDLMLKSRCLLARGRRDEARAALTEAIELAQQTGLGFMGASLLACMALVTDEPGERRRWVEQGEALLAGDCLAHARLMFYRDAIDIALADGRLDDALRHADGLEACTQAEPLPMATVGVARARALVRLRRDGSDPELDVELRRLAELSRRGGAVPFADGIEAALSTAARGS